MRDGEASAPTRAPASSKRAGGGYGFAEINRCAAAAEAVVDREQLAETQSQVAQLVQVLRRVEGYDARKEGANAAEAAHH